MSPIIMTSMLSRLLTISAPEKGVLTCLGFRSALTRVMNSFSKKYDLIQKGKGSQLAGSDLREGLTAVISVKLQNPQFEGQTKTKLGNSEMKGIVDSLLDEGLTDYVETNPKVGKLIVQKALAAQRVREAARKAQDLARRKTSLESTNATWKAGRIVLIKIRPTANSSWLRGILRVVLPNKGVIVISKRFYPFVVRS